MSFLIQACFAVSMFALLPLFVAGPLVGIVGLVVVLCDDDADELDAE